jgi:hypothetical protein
MRSLAFVLPLGLIACGSGNAPSSEIEIGETRYSVAAGHISSLSREPHQFIRIKPPESQFDLVYDSRTTGRRDRFGWPLIFSLNDERGPDIYRHRRDDLSIVCREAVHPRGGCGFKLSHAGAEWTVLFPNDQLEAASVIRQRAIRALDGYRG